ncbi:MAG: CCA tRNA nucleotidyltransferase [Planctomycetaceae bacterium]
MSCSRYSTTDLRREFALDVVRQLRTAGFQSLWAGGCVRDQLLGKDPKDYDVATNALPKDVIRVFGEQRTVPVGAAFGVVMIPGPTRRHGQVEVATFRSDGEYLDGRHPETVQFCSSAEDAKRRDFTINGMFFDPIADTVLDYVGGQEDLQRRIIRAIGDPLARFREDHLRMLRAVRFAATFSFTLEAQTLTAIQQISSRITSVSVERIMQELRRMLAHPSRAAALELLQRSLLLPEVLPELITWLKDPLRFAEACRTFENLESVRFEPALAMLLRPLHDVTKSESRQRLLAIHAICRRLKMANEEIDGISWILESFPTLQHIANRPLHVLKPLLADSRAPLLLAASAAADAADGKPANDASFAWHYLSRTTAEQINPPPFINGNDLRQLGVPMGPEIRRILTAVRIAQLDEHLPGRAAALELARQLISSDRTSPR